MKYERRYSQRSDPKSDGRPRTAVVVSNALKIGGNVLHSITAYKRALWGSWGKKTLILSQHEGM